MKIAYPFGSTESRRVLCVEPKSLEIPHGETAVPQLTSNYFKYIPGIIAIRFRTNRPINLGLM